MFTSRNFILGTNLTVTSLCTGGPQAQDTDPLDAVQPVAAKADLTLLHALSHQVYDFRQADDIDAAAALFESRTLALRRQIPCAGCSANRRLVVERTDIALDERVGR